MSTATATRPTASSPAPVDSPPLHRITVNEYEKIIASGALEDPSRVELIDGSMVNKMGKKAEHSYATIQTTKALAGAVASRLVIAPGATGEDPDYDEPEPDVSIVRGSDADYEHRIPTAADVGLLVEVSDTTLKLDRSKRLPIYARSKIPVYWIVNLVDRQVEVYSRPGKSGYRSHRIFTSGEQVPVTIGGQELLPIPVDSLLPRLKPTKGKGRPKGNGA